MIHGLVSEGYSLDAVYAMTLRQLLLFVRIVTDEKRRRMQRERHRLF